MNSFTCLLLAALSVMAAEAIRTYQFMLPMRDGVKLHTRVTFPDSSSDDQKFTAVVDRSPYGGDALELLADLYVPAGFVSIGQDMRGTGKSEGNFTIWHSDANDSQDLGDWIVKQPWSDGKVFTFGASADGLAGVQVPRNNPKWLQSSYIIWSSSLAYEIIFPNGAYLYSLAQEWMESTVGDQAPASLATIKENEAHTNWWDEISLAGLYGNVRGPSGFWAGWYDIFLLGTLAAYDGYNFQSSIESRGKSLITIDPLGHCQDASIYFTEDLIAGRTLLALAQSYQVYGYEPIYRYNIQNVTFYVMSSNDDAGREAGQFWTTMERFPAPKMTKYYLHGDRSISTSAPSSSESVASTSYVYDPSNPIPSMGGNNLEIPCGPLDQAEIDQRSDVVVFQTPVTDSEVAMTGPLFANLFVSSSAIDTDFMVRISDVYPTGEARLLQDNAIRMRWREGGLSPVYMSAGQVYETHMTLWNTSYVLAPGHSLRVSICSSNYPRFDVNPNNGILLADQQPTDANVTATNVIYHSAQYPSSVILPIVSKLQLPKIHDIKAEVKKAYAQVDWEFVEKKYPDLLYSTAKKMM